MRDANYTETIEFLSAFFRDTLEAVELRALPNASGVPKVEFTRNPLRVIAFCQHYDGIGWGVYFGIATRDEAGRGGGREYCRELPALWAEIDIHKFGMSVEIAVGILLACALPPSLIVSSGRGLHVYWMLSPILSVTSAPFGKDAEKERVERVTRSFVRIFHGDPNAVDLTRILRLPGTHNTREGDLKPCRILEASWVRYELEQVEAFAALSPVLIEAPAAEVSATAGATPNKAAATPAETVDPDDPFASYAQAMAMDVESELAAMALHDEKKPLHWTRMRVAGSLVARGHSDDAIFKRLMADTQRVVTEAGEVWTASREKFEAKRLSDEIRGARAKGYDKVVQLRTGTGEQQNPEPHPSAEPATELAPQFMGYPLNDLGNTMRMLKLYGENIRYCISVGWFLWDGKRFAYDPEGNRVRRRAQATAARMRAEAGKLAAPSEAAKKTLVAIFKFAIGAGNKRSIDGMLSEARPQVPVTADDLDRDRMLLNCRNGTVDLRTGELRPHAREDLLSKLAGTDYEPDAACPQWEKFISEIFESKQEVIDFVQRALGYSLTGDTREEVIFILHGAGANGKTVLIETVAAVMGDYVKHSPADTWTASPVPQASHDLAALVGARFVPVVETERGKQLAEARIKQATGGDKLPARHMYRDWFEYQPQFKLWFATNHKPKIRGSDHAIWRRVYLIPFLVRFVDKEKADDEGGKKIKDPELTEKLRKELPGILTWMVRGCLEWQRLRHLNPPEEVMTATQDYQAGEDNISGFIEDRCNVRHSLREPFGLLYAAYQLWCEADPEEPIEPQSKKAFGAGLTDRGLIADRTDTARKRKGIDIKWNFKEAARLRWEKDKAVPPKTAEYAENKEEKP